MVMKPAILLLLALALAGCTPRYVLRLNSGHEITAAGKPKYKDGYYYFTDPAGRAQVMPSSRVRTIEPASMAKEDAKRYAPQPAKVKPHRHWYFLWLA
jgi:hypothetical protein